MNLFYLLVLILLTLSSCMNSVRWGRIAQREHYIQGYVTKFYFRWVRLVPFNNLYFFFVTSFIGIILIMLIFKENKNTLILFLLLIFGFSSYQIFQKYFEPMFITLLFSLIEFSKIKLIFKNYINIVLFQSYFIVYLISAIINDIFKIIYPTLRVFNKLLVKSYLMFNFFFKFFNIYFLIKKKWFFIFLKTYISFKP